MEEGEAQTWKTREAVIDTKEDEGSKAREVIRWRRKGEWELRKGVTEVYHLKL